MRFKRLKQPKISPHDHSFSPINNPEIVLEISAVTEYFGTIFIPILRKIKKWFSGKLERGLPLLRYGGPEVFDGHEKHFFLFFLIRG